MEHKEKIKGWIKFNLQAGDKLNTEHTSYGYKHIVERHICEYVSNDEFIECMEELGFKRKQESSTSPNYNYYLKVKKFICIDEVDFYRRNYLLHTKVESFVTDEYGFKILILESFSGDRKARTVENLFQTHIESMLHIIGMKQNEYLLNAGKYIVRSNIKKEIENLINAN